MLKEDLIQVFSMIVNNAIIPGQKNKYKNDLVQLLKLTIIDFLKNSLLKDNQN
jgi:hypothetical protein